MRCLTTLENCNRPGALQKEAELYTTKNDDDCPRPRIKTIQIIYRDASLCFFEFLTLSFDPSFHLFADESTFAALRVIARYAPPSMTGRSSMI